jgi:hypothetical protein
MTRGRGFGKAAQALPVKAKGKLQNYTMQHLGIDGLVRVVRLKARSKSEALEKFRVFVETLELCLAGVSDEELQCFMEENPLP